MFVACGCDPVGCVSVCALCALSVPLLEILKDTLRSLAEGRIGHRVVSFRVVQ